MATTLWFPTSYFASGAVANAETVAGQNGLLLSGVKTGPGVYAVPDEFVDTVLDALPMLTARPAYRDTVLSMGPIAYWPLDEAPGLVAQDIVGGRTLIPSGTPLRAQPSLLPSGEGACTVFDGTSAEYLRQGIDDASLDFTGLSPFSVSAWTYSNTPDGTATYGISKRATAGTIGGNIFMYRPSSQLALYRYDSAGTASSLPSPLGTAPQGTIMHYAGTYDGVTMRVYLNGALSVSVASSRVQNDSSANLTIGGPAHTTSSTYNGGIQEACIWNRALSDDEIETLWRVGH